MVLSIEMDPADRGINRKAYIKTHAASPSSYKNPSKLYATSYSCWKLGAYSTGTVRYWNEKT